MNILDQNRVIVDLEGLAEEQLELLKPVEDSWQPSDFLPDMGREDWQEKVCEMRANAASLSDEALIILVGNMVTEEALPSYQTWLNRPDILKDETGASLTPWARWSRGWTAEENRHGDLLHQYLCLTGRVNMRSLQVTIQHLIRNGFDTKSSKDPYSAIVYVSFQERATKISHTNMGRLAEKCGEQALHRICGAVAGDEARHEEAYKRFFRRIVELDPANAVISFADMMKKRIEMPARLMFDGTEEDLFSQFAVVAQRAEVYTYRDYADILKHLVDYWGIALLKNLRGEAAEAQDTLCRMYDKYLIKSARIREALFNFPPKAFDWIFGRTV